MTASRSGISSFTRETKIYHWLASLFPHILKVNENGRTSNHDGHSRPQSFKQAIPLKCSSQSVFFTPVCRASSLSITLQWLSMFDLDKKFSSNILHYLKMFDRLATPCSLMLCMANTMLDENA